MMFSGLPSVSKNLRRLNPTDRLQILLYVFIRFIHLSYNISLYVIYIVSQNKLNYFEEKRLKN